MTVSTHDHLEYERAFWSDCTNTYGEESKQFVYARCMGLPRQGLSFDVRGARILDVGGGPASILLKTINLREGLIYDPIQYPDWVMQRYAVKNVGYVAGYAEEMTETGWDECWVYNVLQHVEDPERVVANARRAAPVLRIFEWIDMRPYEGHPNTLTTVQLSDWLGGLHGGVQQFNGESGCYGKAFFGAFQTGA
jgi:hypothetical protein